MVYLKLAGLKISDALLREILCSCPNINFLILDRSYGFSNIPIMPQGGAPKGPEIAKYCPKLLHLSLDACTAITDRCISEITQSCPNLKYINIASLYRDSNISSASVIEIARSCPSLVYLNLNGQPSINDESICVIARSCVNLQHLDLSFNEIITDKAICAIATGCPDMRNYFLEGCERITDKSIKKIAQLNRNLQKLILTSCYKITDNAICDIVRSCSNIQNLSFQYIYITDKTIYEITHHCSNLLVLNAKKCPFISDESIYYLLSKKPALELILDWVP